MSNTHRSAVYDRIYESTIFYTIPSFSYFVTRIVILILNTKIMNEDFATMIDHTGPHVAPNITRNDYIFRDLSIIMTSLWARWRLKPPVYRLFTQPFFFRRRSKKISKLRVTALCVGRSPVPRTKGQQRKNWFHLMTLSRRTNTIPMHFQLKVSSGVTVSIVACVEGVWIHSNPNITLITWNKLI